MGSIVLSPWLNVEPLLKKIGCDWWVLFYYYHDWLWTIIYNYCVYRELYKNNLVGRIPKELGNLKSLVSLDLYHNNLSGDIPPSLGKLNSLRFLRLNGNKLTGRIPRELMNLSSLKIIDLSENDLCGTIPTSGSFSKFTEKSFENNPRLNGPELMGSVVYDLGCNW